METVQQIKAAMEALKSNVEEKRIAFDAAKAEYAAALAILKPEKKAKVPRKKKGEAVPVAAHARRAPKKEAEVETMSMPSPSPQRPPF